jgi:hypothetical protein
MTGTFEYVVNSSPEFTPLPVPSMTVNAEDAPGKPCSCEKEQPTHNACGFTPTPLPLPSMDPRKK